MNKYQEALDYLRWIGGDGYYKEQREKSFDVLQELVDKDTPKKVLREQDKLIAYYHGKDKCPNCKIHFSADAMGQNFIFTMGYIKHCYACGQMLDWSDEG